MPEGEDPAVACQIRDDHEHVATDPLAATAPGHTAKTLHLQLVQQSVQAVLSTRLGTSTTTPDISPTTAASPRLHEPLPIPVQNLQPFPASPSASGTADYLFPHSSPFQEPRRGLPLTSPNLNRNAEMELTRLASPGAGPSRLREADGANGTSLKPKARFDDRGKAKTQGQSKEEMAMAKWRNWIVEQPVDGSPKAQGSNNIPMMPLAPPRTRDSSTRTDSRTDSSSSRIERVDFAKMDPINTETMRALQDVELAVDENVLSKSRRGSAVRRMSTNPRVSQLENPFIDLGARLGSRRVRPLVIELIQGLGHYVDAVWCMRFPDTSCPWVIDKGSAAPVNDAAWRSRMITAVQEGKAAGFVRPPTKDDLKFWEDEVKYSLQDVDDVVGIYKGVAWAFNTAFMTGRYGEVATGNTVGPDGEGGNIARLLNDMEEAMWGDAPPRATDLAYELPEDFDPYAMPSAEESLTAGPTLSAFFSLSQPQGQHTAVPAEVYDVSLPELQMDRGSDASRSPVSSAASATPALGSDPLGLEAYRTEGTPMTLEEIGRKRHEEWLASRSNVPW